MELTTAVLARKFIQTGRVGLTWLIEPPCSIGTVEDIEVAVINDIAGKDIGDEFQERGFSNTSLSNEKDGVWPIRPVFRCFNDPPPERLYVTRKYRYT